jgi:hypothetical protein
MLLLWTLCALAAEPGAAKGRFDSDCACVEVDPGVHAPDRYSTAWLPIPRADALEHLVLVNKDFLSAVFATEGRVSIAERDDVGPTVARVQVVRPDIPFLDNNSRNPCKHIVPTDIAAPDVLIFLELTEDPRTDAAAVGKVIKTRRVGLGQCLGSAGEAHVALKVSGSGKAKASIVGSTLGKEGESCVLTNLSKLRADVSQKAPGTLQFALVTGR